MQLLLKCSQACAALGKLKLKCASKATSQDQLKLLTGVEGLYIHVLSVILSVLLTNTSLSRPARFRPYFDGDSVSVRGSVKALANEDTLLSTQMFPRLPARASFVAGPNFVSGTQKMFLILLRNILCPLQMFPSPRSIMGNNVSATMCPRLPGSSQSHPR